MRNPITRFSPKSLSLKPSSSSDATPASAPRPERRRGRSTALAVGSVVVIGGLLGTGFVTQSAFAQQAQREAATAELSASTGLRSEQLGAYSAVLHAHAARKADAALAIATPVIAAAQGKADASALAGAVATLSAYAELSADEIFTLAGEVETGAAAVQAAVVEADRVAAEQAAAAEAAKKAALAQAAASVTPGSAQAIARDMLAARGWGDDQFSCLVSLWNKESGWRVNALNASSGAAGIPQALPGNKMASHGADWQTNPATQIAWGLDYISGRYGTPCGAWAKAQSSGWY